MSNKPLVFNYREYDTLRDKANDMAVEIESLRTQNKSLENIIYSQQRTIDKYHEIFQLQEAELERLRNDSKLQDHQQKV